MKAIGSLLSKHKKRAVLIAFLLLASMWLVNHPTFWGIWGLIVDLDPFGAIAVEPVDQESQTARIDLTDQFVAGNLAMYLEVDEKRVIGYTSGDQIEIHISDENGKELARLVKNVRLDGSYLRIWLFDFSVSAFDNLKMNQIYLVRVEGLAEFQSRILVVKPY